MFCKDCSNNDELFVFEHDSNAWICNRQAITLREEAGGMVQAKVREGGLVWGWIGVFCKCFPVENCYFTGLWQDFILECKGRTEYLGMVGTVGGW